MYYNSTKEPTDWQRILQRMEKLYLRLSCAERELFDLAVLTGDETSYLASMLHKSESTIRNQKHCILHKAIESGYEAGTPWNRIRIEAGIYSYVRETSRLRSN